MSCCPRISQNNVDMNNKEWLNSKGKYVTKFLFLALSEITMGNRNFPPPCTEKYLGQQQNSRQRRDFVEILRVRYFWVPNV